jgi:hypothetical protein
MLAIKYGMPLVVMLATLTPAPKTTPLDTEIRDCGVWSDPVTTSICSTNTSTVYATEAEAQAASAPSYEYVASQQIPYYISDFVCSEICPPESVGCEKVNRFQGSTSVVVKAVAAPAPPGGYYAMTCHEGTTRTEGCRPCRKIEA